ncbi:MAG: Gfo/Idh/MocA family oxidoreductase [Bdellovibrionales bacterium]|nr:Gfo/Idh/MocA family oxidoreductase [Bdellovibrionales bacterium]
MKPVKVAIIGHGHLGKWHAQKAELLPNAHLVAIVDKFNNVDSFRTKLKESYPQAKMVVDVSEVIDEIDAAVVVTPTSTHYEICEYLIEKGKHIFCEKPMTANLEEALNLEKLIKKNSKLVFQVGHSERCHKVWENIKQFEGFLSGPSQIKISRLGPFKARATDVDVVSDLMIHDLDILIHFFKSVPKLVDAYGFKSKTNKWDVVSAQFILPETGSRALIQSSRDHVEEVRSIEVVNEKGTLQLDLLDNKILFTTKEDGIKRIDFGKNDHLLLEHEYFYQAILNGKEVLVDIHDGVKAVDCVQQVLDYIEAHGEKDAFENPQFLDLKNQQ